MQDTPVRTMQRHKDAVLVAAEAIIPTLNDQEQKYQLWTRLRNLERKVLAYHEALRQAQKDYERGS